MDRRWRILSGRPRPNWRGCTTNCVPGRIVRNRCGGLGYPSPAARSNGRWGYRRCAIASCKARCGTYWNRSSRRNLPGSSYGFRPGRGAKDALRRVDTLLKAGHVWVVDADLKSYFDTIPHDRLLARVKERVADGRVLALVESFLRAGVLEEAKGWQPTERGTPQGGVISPLLANVYLDPLDHQMEQAGWAMVRYADDFVILCRSEAEAQAALATVRHWVSGDGTDLASGKDAGGGRRRSAEALTSWGITSSGA